MKKGALVFIAALVAVGLYIGLSGSSSKPKVSKSPEPEVLGVPAEDKGVEIKVGENAFKAFYLGVPNTQDITLIPNFGEKETARNIFEKGSCKALISGGFYTPEGSPTGLFVSEGSQIKKYVSSSLANGVYSINDFETPRITREVPRDHLRVALQAGPLLIENSFTQNLRLIRDEEARRIVIGVTGENQTVFMVFYNPNSVFIGPTLDSLPEVLESFQEKTGVELADAMNLDGGTASTFFSSEVRLPEATPVGSFFCIR